ncbi:unnamed protein product [Boreogadus saida]
MDTGFQNGGWDFQRRRSKQGRGVNGFNSFTSRVKKVIPMAVIVRVRLMRAPAPPSRRADRHIAPSDYLSAVLA